MKEPKKTDINEIIRLAFRKYKLKGRSQMDTFVFTQTKSLSDEDFDKICNTLDNQIVEYEYKKRQKADEEIQKEIEKIILKVV